MAPSEKEAQLMGLLSSSGTVSATSSTATSDSEGSPKLPVAHEGELKRDEKQQQMIRDTMKAKRASATVAAQPSHKRTESKSKFGTLVDRVKSELKVKKSDSSSRIAASSGSASPPSGGLAEEPRSGPSPVPPRVSSEAALSRNSSPSVMQSPPPAVVAAPAAVASPPPPQLTAAPRTGVKKAVATYYFVAEEEGEISFEVGEKIDVYSFEPDGWGVGCNAAGQTGEFPVNRVQFVSETETLRNTLAGLLDDGGEAPARALPPPPQPQQPAESEPRRPVSPAPATGASASGPPPPPLSKKPKLVALKKKAPPPPPASIGTAGLDEPAMVKRPTPKPVQELDAGSATQSPALARKGAPPQSPA
jgi:hypothetical protein